MRQIVLITDFGTDDIYLGLLKAKISSETESKIIDLHHNIVPYNIKQGNFFLNMSQFFFGDEVIFCSIISPNVCTTDDILICKKGDNYYVAPNNGILSGIIDNRTSIYFLNPSYLENYNRRHYNYIFGSISAEIANNNCDIIFGEKASKSDVVTFDFAPAIEKDMITGEIMNIDRFGNIITNIKAIDLNNYTHLQVGKNLLTQKLNNYNSAASGELFFYIGEFGTIEIALKNDRADKKLNCKLFDVLKIKKVLPNKENF